MFWFRWPAVALVATLVAASSSMVPLRLGQTTQDDRVAALETTVAEHERDIEALETAVAPATHTHDQEPTTVTPSAEQSNNGIVVSGEGDTVTDTFRLPSGVARVAARYSGQGSLYVDIYNSQGDSKFLFAESGPYEGTKAFRVQGGEYYLAVEIIGGESGDEWVITFSFE